MTTDIRAALDAAELALSQGDSHAARQHIAAARAALAEPVGEGPTAANAITCDDWLAVAMIAQDMRSRGVAEQACGDELLKLANSNRSQPAHPAAPPAPEVGEV